MEMSGVEKFSKADLHIHTNVFDGFDKPHAVVDFVDNFTDLSVIAITDHNMIKGAKRALEYSESVGSRVKVIVGCEVNTRTRAHVIGLFLKRPIKIFKKLEDTIADIHSQGGIAVAVHPFNRMVQGISLKAFKEIMANPDPFFRFDCLEVLNSSPTCKKSSRKALELSSSFDIALSGASDSHQKELIGTAYTIFKGETLEDLKTAIANRTTIPGGGFVSFKNTSPRKLLKGAVKAWGLGVPLMAYYYYKENVRKVVRS